MSRTHHDWPVWRHDSALTGRSMLSGNLTNAPAVSWQYPLTGMRGLLVVSATQPGRSMTAECGQPLGQDYLTRCGRKWGMHPFSYKLRNGETLGLSEAADRRVGGIHPDLPEPQEVVFTGKQSETRGQLYAWDTSDGKRREVWSSPGGEAAWERWNICFGDIDGDGVEDVIVAGHGGVMIYDSRSGKLKCECSYGHRSRGFIGVADIDGDGADEFLDIGLFQIAVEVCDYKPGAKEGGEAASDGELSVLWGDKIELNIRAHPRMINTPFDALCDIDGDGKYEVVYNLYNDHGDDQWHLVIRDALTGEVRWDIPQVFLSDSVDLDSDRVRELVGICTEGRFCQGFSRAFIAHLKPDGLKPLWTHDAARWPARPVLKMPRDRSTFRSAGGPIQVCQGDFLGDGYQGLIFSIQPGGVGTPETFSVVKKDNNGGYHTAWSMEAPAARLTQIRAIADVDSDGADEVLIEWRSNGSGGATAKGCGARAEIVSLQPLMPRLGQPIAADIHGRGNLTVLATSAVDEVVAIAPPSSRRDKPRELWRRFGRGHDQINCLSAADLTGDGRCEVVSVSQAPSGKARVTAVDGDGKTVWYVDYDDIHGQRYIFRMGGLTHLWVAHLADSKRSDVYVSILRSIMHSDVAYALRGTDGQLLWKQSMAGNTGYGGSGMGFADTNGDGLDEIFCSYPDCYWTADGRTGEVALFTNPGKVFPNWAAYAVPIVADFNGDGKPEVFHPSQYVWGLLTLDGEKIWNLPGEDVPRSGVLPGLGDVDGDGKIALGAPFPDGFRCYSADTGKLKWKLEVPAGSYAGTISADVDGDGRDEFLFAAGNQLVAVEAAGDNGRILWQVELPARISEPIFADVDGDGYGEILLTCEDGMLYCLD
ncbi:hypothetical protein ACFL6S_30870 [Candidatus Poribacteria bacterium]